MTAKQRLQKTADKLWFNKHIEENCEVCGCSEYLQVHHFFPKSSYPQLRYHDENGVTLCRGCHFRHHHVGDPAIQQYVIENRGINWYAKLLEESKKKIKPSFKTEKYLKDIIERLGT